MGRASNTLKVSDVVTTPIKLKYSASYSSTNLAGTGIYILTGSNGSITSQRTPSQSTINYNAVKHLYYINYLSGSSLVSGSGYDNNLQSTAAVGTQEADIRLFPTQSGALVTVLNIPRLVYGEKIARYSFELTSSAYRVKDDGNGNLIDSGQSGSLYVSSSYVVDGYVGSTDAIHVGNLIYAQGIAIITENYQ